MNSVAAESSYSHLLLMVEKEAPRLLDTAIKAGQLQLSKLVETEQRLAKRHIVVVPGTDRALYSLLFQTTDESQKISLGALRAISTSIELVKRFLCFSDLFSYRNSLTFDVLHLDFEFIRNRPSLL